MNYVLTLQKLQLWRKSKLKQWANQGQELQTNLDDIKLTINIGAFNSSYKHD